INAPARAAAFTKVFMSMLLGVTTAGVITVLSSLADRFAQAGICTAIIGNRHGNARFGLSPSNVRRPKRVVLFSFNEGPYIPNRCALMISRRWRTGSKSILPENV